MGPSERISVSVNRSVLATWRDYADLEGVSLSGAVADFMANLEPGLQDAMRLRRAYKRAEALQQDTLLQMVATAATRAEEALNEDLGDWQDVLTAADEIAGQE